uniref:Protein DETOXIFICATION n=1 Tax=Aegilops tauschii subsp. strangulata TaxID=200361 RepID=A0A453LK73_AEGTS
AVGSGWQVIVAYVNVGAYYIIGLPIGCVLGFKTSLGAAGDLVGLDHRGRGPDGGSDRHHGQDQLGQRG